MLVEESLEESSEKALTDASEIDNALHVMQLQVLHDNHRQLTRF
jgi:hypothetical protein